ncbi:potassium transporter 11-like [Apium graveolens]|uniref:potassium transporter 11-like n=1 Tax=Apium graveolens TaxID=4045 RepID=UPI003D7ADD2A
MVLLQRFVYTELASGVPHIFSRIITNLPAIHSVVVSVVVFVCVKYHPVYTVPEDERSLIKRIGPNNFHMFRCVAKYGYKDPHKKDDEFEKKLFDNLFLFVQLESMMDACSISDEYSLYNGQKTHQSRGFTLEDDINSTLSSINQTILSVDSIIPVTNTLSRHASSQTEADEMEFLTRCREAGVVHILGNIVVRARKGSGIPKKIAIDYIYAFLRKICRDNSVILNLPQDSLLNVGQIFYV